MQNSLNDLMKTAVYADEKKCPVREVFFDPETHKMAYLALDIGGWFNVDEVIVSADILEPPAPGRGHWLVRLDETSLEAAPRWTEGIRDDLVDLQAWPPVFVGPFGGTYSPILLYEQAVAASRTKDQDHADAPDGDKLVFKMERAGEWIGLAAYGRDGELGEIADLLIDPQTLKINTLLIRRGNLLNRETGALPMSRVRHMADQRTHIVLNAAVDDLAPDGT